MVQTNFQGLEHNKSNPSLDKVWSMEKHCTFFINSEAVKKVLKQQQADLSQKVVEGQ